MTCLYFPFKNLGIQRFVGLTGNQRKRIDGLCPKPRPHLTQSKLGQPGIMALKAVNYINFAKRLKFLNQTALGDRGAL